MSQVVLKVEDLDGFLTEQDKKSLSEMNELYSEALSVASVLNHDPNEKTASLEKERLIQLYNQMGEVMQKITKSISRIHIYSFESPSWTHGEASRLIAKLRDARTENSEFVYYIQRAYELLFNLAYGGVKNQNKNYLIVKTPVSVPVQNYAVHKIPDIDKEIEDTIMCVMLRGALLPSMIMSKEFQEYSSTKYVTPFALFKIKRRDDRKATDMEYVLDLDKSYFNLDDLKGKNLIFADPMNATGGSFVTILKYLKSQDVKPKSIKFFNVISALQGALNVVRAHEDVEIYTLWMDPVLNELAYILPGLGDAGDRLNGIDSETNPRNILQLIADYGINIINLYRSQVIKIEETILGD